jgi:peptidoglycan hydrolase-like protein with peptidoglycan-binding domain
LAQLRCWRWGVGGAALDFSADAGDVPNASENTLSIPEASHHWINAANLSKDDVRWAQAELHYVGLYNGSLDGVIGPETKRALAGFQKSAGLERTATLDQQTADALIGNTGGTGQGSSLPPRNAGIGSMTSSSGTNDFGRHGGPK